MGVTGFRKKSIRFDLALLSLIVMMPSWFGTEAHGETFVGKAVLTEMAKSVKAKPFIMMPIIVKSES
jgi:hypothetical protein